MRWVVFCGAGLLVLAGPGYLAAKEKPAPPAAFWAWKTPLRPPVPALKNAAGNPIDAFIGARLEKAGLTPGPAADRPTLIRRLSFDLIGLPPTLEEIDAFVQDSSPGAYEKLVDRLLASPRYGERWALYWLDLVRYAESDGFKADDVRANAWRYRDYVIQALNQDKPYDRFIREQIAGDELYPGDPDALAATAFNRHFPDEYNARNLEQRRQEILNDMTDTTSLVFLGLTAGCARCHDHKYDPITQKDYYRLQAFYAAFWYRDNAPLAGYVDSQKFEASLRVWDEATQKLRSRMNLLEEPVRQKLIGRDKVKYPKEIQEAYDMPPEKRTTYQKQLADMVSRQLQVKPDLMTKAMAPQVRKEWQELRKKMTEYEHLQPRPLAGTLAISDISPTSPPTFLLQRGNWRNKGLEVQPGFFAILDPRPPTIPGPGPGAQTTGRRSVLAKWLSSPDNPFTARVMVNRLWQHHFGKGIVGTPSDFGVLGDPPTHPELLDWLAREFIERSWSLKAMHRLMVTSATYRQATQWRDGPGKKDPNNTLLWRMNRRRLQGEALRDAMLSASGLLNLKPGGPSVFPELPEEVKVKNWTVSPDVRDRQRRSVYVFAKRNLRYPLFEAFDAPDSNESCARRHVSTNAPQALMLLNSKITLDIARAFAGRILREGKGTPLLIERAYRLALGRLPTEREWLLATDFLAKDKEILQKRLAAKLPVSLPTEVPPRIDPAFAGAVVDFCHVVLNLNEFAYVD